jgi:hypothetical protein
MIATAFSQLTVTDHGLADSYTGRIPRPVFDSMEFLEKALRAAGGVKAELGRILDLPSSRIDDYWKPKGQGKRTLSMEEGVKLCEALDLPPLRRVSEEMLLPVLRVCLRHGPGSPWPDRDVERLAGCLGALTASLTLCGWSALWRARNRTTPDKMLKQRQNVRCGGPAERDRRGISTIIRS